MRVARLISLEFSRNLSMTLPSDYTPLTIAEVFYMATMGGAQGTYQTTRVHEPSQVVCIIIRIVHILLVNCYCTCCNLNKWRDGIVWKGVCWHVIWCAFCFYAYKVRNLQTLLNYKYGFSLDQSLHVTRVSSYHRVNNWCP